MKNTGSKRDGSYGMSAGAFVGGSVCLGLTAWILHGFGKMTGANAEAQQIFSWANVFVHVLGFVFMGLAVGYFLNPRSRNWYWVVPCALLMVSAGGYTFTNLYGFASAQRITATKKIEEQKKRIDDKAAERTLLARKRQEAQERLAKSQLGFMQAEVKDAQGRARRQLTKDFAKNSAEIIAEIGKEAVAAPDAKVETEVDADVGAQELAKIAGMTTEMVQVGLAMWLAKLFVGLEMLLWPMASFTCPRKIAVDTGRVIEGTARDITPATVAAPEAVTGLIEPPQPAPAELATEPVATPTRNPLPGSEAALAEVGFPIGPMTGPKRPKRTPEEAAQGFKVYLQAFDLVRDPLTDQDMSRLYEQYNEADHREAAAENLMRGELKRLRGVEWGKPRKEPHADGRIKRGAIWRIKPGKYPKVAVTENPKQGGGNIFALVTRPLAEAPAHEPADVAMEPTDQTMQGEKTEKRRQVQFDHPALNAARAHWMRRDARHFNKKQRGSRSGRRAA